MSLKSRSLICFLLLRSAILLKAAVGAHCMSPSDDDRYTPSRHRPTNQNTPSPECRASEVQYESRAVSLFALRSLSRPRYSWLTARISRSWLCRSSGTDFRAKERLLAVYIQQGAALLVCHLSLVLVTQSSPSSRKECVMNPKNLCVGG